ncbi:MAG: OmpH family outer membrane protein [Phycisphaerales bacterium JB065]
MKRFDRILFCLLTVGVCSIAAQQLLRANTAVATEYLQDGEAKTSHENHIAVCAINLVMKSLLESDRFLPAREAINVDELIQEYQNLEAQMNALRQQWEQLQGGQTDPNQIQSEGERLQAEAERIGTRMQEIQELAKQRDQELQQLTLEQLKEAYELARDAAEAVSEDLGYDYVIASQRPDDEFNLNFNALPAEFNARPMLVFPEDADITLDVMSELNLD